MNRYELEESLRMQIDSAVYETTTSIEDLEVDPDSISIESFVFRYGSIEDIELDMSDVRFEGTDTQDVTASRREIIMAVTDGMMEWIENNKHELELGDAPKRPSFTTDDFRVQLVQMLFDSVKDQFVDAALMTIKDGVLTSKAFDCTKAATTFSYLLEEYFINNIDNRS